MFKSPVFHFPSANPKLIFRGSGEVARQSETTSIFDIYCPWDILLLFYSYAALVYSYYYALCIFWTYLHTAVTNLQYVPVEILCSLCDFGKCLLINRRKVFATFVDTALLNGELNQIIFPVLFFWFLSLIFGVFKIKFEPAFLQRAH